MHRIQLILIAVSLVTALPLFANGGATGVRIGPFPSGIPEEAPRLQGAKAEANAAVAPSNAASPHDCGTACWTTGTYRYDPAGNISAMGSETFRYDASQRLASATLLPPGGATVVAHYTYDAFGNIHAVSFSSSASGLSSNTFSIDRESNRVSGNVYDAAGSVTRIAATGATLEWDGAAMLVRYSGGRRTAYLYTVDDERIATFDLASGGGPMQATWTLRGLDKSVLRVFESFGGATATDTWRWRKDYLYGPGGRVLATDAATDGIRHFHLDHLGTPRLITDRDAVKVAEHAYSPFGSEMTDKAQDAEPMKFTGHERDVMSATEDFDYMHARFYVPVAGRFLSVDPKSRRAALATPQLYNRYAYALNNPLINVDLNGEDVTPVRVLIKNKDHLKTAPRIAYVDSRMVPRLQKLVSDASASGVSFSFNNLLRTPEQQDAIKTSNTKNNKGTSPHTAGLAIDINVCCMQGTDLAGITRIARDAGLQPLVNQEKDKPHFQANDLITRDKKGKVDDEYKALVEENQQQVEDFEKMRKENPEEFEKLVVTILPNSPPQ